MRDQHQEFAALHAPIAPFSWGLEAELSNTVPGTGDISIHFNRPIEIMGMKAIVIPKRPLIGGGLVIPAVDDILVQLITDNEDIWTKNVNDQGGKGGFVSLGHLTVDTPRLLRIVPKGEAPDLQFQFNWRQFVSAAAPIYEIAEIDLTLFTRYLEKAEHNALLAAGK